MRAMLSEMNENWKQQIAVSGEENAKIKNWLGDRDSNPDKQSQSLLSCR